MFMQDVLHLNDEMEIIVNHSQKEGLALLILSKLSVPKPKCTPQLLAVRRRFHSPVYWGIQERISGLQSQSSKHVLIMGVPPYH